METMLLNIDASRRRNIRIKTSRDYLEKLDGYIVALNKKLKEFSDISYAGHVIVSAKELAELYDSNQTIFSPKQRLERMGRRVEGIAKKYRLAEFEAHYKNILECSEFYTPMEAKKLAGINIGRMFSEVDRKIDEMTNVDWTRYYLGFIKESFPEVYDITLKHIDRKYLLQEDIVPFAYFLQEMGSGLSMGNIKHVIIDELQDYSYISIKFLSKVFANAGFTLLGDQNQALCRDIESYDPGKHHEMFENRSVELISLSKSYRSSYEIYEFCRRILKDDIYDSSAVNRHESLPEVIRLGDKDIYDIVKKMLDEGYKTIAIITKTEKMSQILFRELSHMKGKVNLIDSEEDNIKNDINIMPSYFAKGLEFDCVIIPDAGDEEYSREEDRGVLYTVCSRALHKLVVCYTKEPSIHLPNTGF
jgi:DNA helicase-2/ATP-dependent DNA helicase PcrA